MKKVYYNKLIRDKIPEKIKNKGSKLKTRVLGKKEFCYELLKKVGEEANSLPDISSRKELLSELADVLDVIDEIKKFKNITAKEFSIVRRGNLKKKGGFKKHLFLIWSSDDNYKTNEIRYKKPNK